MHFEGLEHKEEIDTFVQQLAVLVCQHHGLEPYGTYEICIGHDEDGTPQVVEMPNWERFDDDIRLTCEKLFNMSSTALNNITTKWREYLFAQAKVMDAFNDVEPAPDVVNRLLD